MSDDIKRTFLGSADHKADAFRELDERMGNDDNALGFAIKAPFNMEDAISLYQKAGEDLAISSLSADLDYICAGIAYCIDAVESNEPAKGKIIERNVTNVTDFNRGVNFCLMLFGEAGLSLQTHKDYLIQTALDHIKAEVAKNESGDTDRQSG